MTSTDGWPSPFRPEQAPVFTHNELKSSLPADALWPILIRASDWPDWYPHATDVQTADGKPDLSAGSAFTWKTLNVKVRTTVTEFDPARTLAWSGTGPASRGYHRWTFAALDEGGCLVVTEEVQIGLVPRLLRRRLQRDLLHHHQEWLDGLVTRAGSHAVD